MDSADRPLDGNRWWMQAEDPFQCLAACMEITKAVRSGDPPSYVCALAVHQDGSCNGLQHYAALGKDVRGAEHVNMMAMEKPADVYTGIAETVREKVGYGSRGLAAGVTWLTWFTGADARQDCEFSGRLITTVCALGVGEGAMLGLLKVALFQNSYVT